MESPEGWSDPRLLELLDRLCAAARVDRRVRPREDADDLRSDVLTRLSGVGPLPGPPPLPVWEAYLRQAVDSAVVDRHRRHVQAEKRAVGAEVREGDLAGGHSPDSAPNLGSLLPGADTTPSQGAARNEDLARLEAGIGRLPADQQQALRLHLEGHGPTEIGRRIGRTADAVTALIYRATLALKTDLG